MRSCFLIGSLIISVFLIVSCKKKEPSPVIPPAELTVNSSFETGGASQDPSGWQTTATASDLDADYSTTDGRAGSLCLEHSKSSAYKVLTYQIINNVDTGFYSLSVWVKNSGGQNSCYISAKDFGGTELMTSLPVSSSWTKVIIRGIHITNKSCTIGFYSDALAGNWCLFDDVILTKDGIHYQFLKGGDISELTYIESKGGKYYDGGVENNCLQILKDNGFNLVRLRLYNDPGNPSYPGTNGYLLPAGFQTTDDILRIAKRSKDMGFKILLTFYYSDFWSNDLTHNWRNLTLVQLKDSIYNFTYNFMNKMKAQGTSPELVSIGNEIAGGMFLPVGVSSNFALMGDLIRQGYNAVKAASPSSKVILHLDDAGNITKYDWFFSACQTNSVSYDIIGASYYPYWSQKSVTQVAEWADYISTKFNKDILIMETGYNWNPTTPDGYQGQLKNGGPYTSVYTDSPAGQRDFLYENFNGIKNMKNGRVIGALYWDPVMIEWPGVGWAVDQKNVVSNSTLFDFNGNVLPSFKAFRFNN